MAEAANEASSANMSVDAGLNTSFAGLVNGHNNMANIISDLGQKVATVEKECAETKKEAQEAGGKQEERTAALETRLEEVQKQNAELQESLKAMLNESCTALREEQTKAIKDFEEEQGIKIKTVEEGLAVTNVEVSSIATVKLPRVQAEIDAEVKKLKTQMEENHKALDAKDLEQDRIFKKQASQLQELQQTFDQRLKSEVDALVAKLGEEVKQATAARAALESTQKEMQAAEKALSEKLDAQVQKLEKLVEEEVKKMRTDVTNVEGTKLEAVEAALKRCDFERLCFTQTCTQELEGIKAHLGSLTDGPVKALETSCKEQAAKLDEVHNKLKEGIDCAVSSLGSRLEKSETGLSSLAERLTSTKGDFSNEVASLKTTLESTKSSCIQGAKEDSAKVQNEVKETQGKIAQMESSLQTFRVKHHGLAEQVGRDLDATRSALANRLEEADRKYEIAESAMGGVQPLQQAVNALVQELEEVTREQKKADESMHKLTAKIMEVEVRVCPWRVTPAPYSARARSPGLNHSAGEDATRSPRPTPPAMSPGAYVRPLSANVRSREVRGAPAPDAMESSTEAPVAGSGMKAAAATRPKSGTPSHTGTWRVPTRRDPGAL